MVRRDIEFRDSLKKGNRKYKYVDMEIDNSDSIENLQKIADKIYSEQILSKDRKPRESMIEKYGGYKIRTPRMKAKSKGKTEKGELNK